MDRPARHFFWSFRILLYVFFREYIYLGILWEIIFSSKEKVSILLITTPSMTSNYSYPITIDVFYRIINDPTPNLFLEDKLITSIDHNNHFPTISIFWLTTYELSSLWDQIIQNSNCVGGKLFLNQRDIQCGSTTTLLSFPLLLKTIATLF